MKAMTIGPAVLAMAFALAGCGGGGGGAGIASTPPPPPPIASGPPPAPSIVPGVTTSQQFAVAGSTYYYQGQETLLQAPANQLQVRYVQASNSYEVQLPGSQSWDGISFLQTSGMTPVNYAGDTAHLWLRDGAYQYSRLFQWSNTSNSIATASAGWEAIGIATPAGSVPTTGSASYSGDIIGFTPEDHGDDFPVDGSILLSFNFALGSLSGSMSPNLHQGFVSAPLSFIDTVYSTGSTTFSGHFDTNAAGFNGFSGLFTGPHAQELIGNFVFPYVSPIDGHTYQANGAFVAK